MLAHGFTVAQMSSCVRGPARLNGGAVTLESAEVDTRADGAIQVVGEPSDTAPDGTIEIPPCRRISWPRAIPPSRRPRSRPPPTRSQRGRAVANQALRPTRRRRRIRKSRIQDLAASLQETFASVVSDRRRRPKASRCAGGAQQAGCILGSLSVHGTTCTGEWCPF
jgi:hypothetical protein